MKKNIGRGLVMAATLALMACGIGNMSAVRPAEAADPTVAEVFDKVKNMNPGLKDYEADINIDLSIHVSVLPVPLSLSGKYFYKSPDHYKLRLEHAPKVVEKYPQIFGWNLPKLKDFNARFMAPENIDGQECYHVQLIPNHQMADLIEQDIWITKDTYVFPKQVTRYRDDGEIDVNVKYTSKDAYHLFDHMNATFTFPKAHVQATANATYANYAVNQNLPDSLFTSSN